jgi:L-lysine 2,3-aminomutase
MNITTTTLEAMNMLTVNELKKIRAAWLTKNLDPETLAVCRRQKVEVPSFQGADPGQGEDWGNWHWHIRNRLTSVEDLIELFPQYLTKKTAAEEWLKNYDFSIMPLNLMLKNGVGKFLPQIGLIPASDPYGVQQEKSVVWEELKGRKYYLATRKPGYATFLPILGGSADKVFCPIGCAGCYRGLQTRFGQPLKLNKEDDTVEDLAIPSPVDQIRMLAKRWNSDPEFRDVYDILISGGEPMTLSNATWSEILQELAKAEYLKSFRICTGALFLGLPFRFDGEFISLLAGFHKQTGASVKISAHVSHLENITPEAVFFARRLIAAGIEILPQMPLEPGVNFWPDDLQKTTETLRQLDRRLALAVGTRSYKWIVDIQKRRINQGVSILSVIEVWRRLHDGHIGESDIDRPTSLALFFPHERGNLNLSYHSLWAIKMTVDQNKRVAQYDLPHPAGGWVKYEEPLWEGVNDDPARLQKLRGEI